jgi:hypothetical protein
MYEAGPRYHRRQRRWQPSRVPPRGCGAVNRQASEPPVRRGRGILRSRLRHGRALRTGAEDHFVAVREKAPRLAVGQLDVATAPVLQSDLMPAALMTPR